MKTPSERISVHHIKELGSVTADLHIYCGRGSNPAGTVNALVGNPFHMENEARRDEVCDAYEKWIDTSDDHKRVIARIATRIDEGLTIALYCWCAPKRCHCDTIRKLALAGLNITTTQP
jgi:hypothetical protein